MIVQVIGNDTLFAATKAGCEAYHTVAESGADILWVCYDTPVGESGHANNEWVIDRIGENLPASVDTLVLVSSQLPVGTTERLERLHPAYTFAYSPENIRVATASQDFLNQSRIVVGIRSDRYHVKLRDLLDPFTDRIIITTPETAEMVKHTLNSWLGMNIAFINEIARVCREVGAAVDVVSDSVRGDARVSPSAPLRAGAPFGGGHLARDIYTLTQLGDMLGIKLPIISHIMESNA